MRAEIKMKIKSESNFRVIQENALKSRVLPQKLLEKNLLLQPPKIYVYTSFLNYFSLLYT